MPLDRTAPENTKSDDSDSNNGLLSEFGSGVAHKLIAPFKGTSQLINGKTDSAQELAEQAKHGQSKAYIAGEFVGSATVFIAATALIKRAPGVGSFAPVAAGGLIGAVEPLKQGEGDKDRIGHAVSGAAAIAVFEYGPKMLVKSGLLASEKGISAALTSGVIGGVITEQANSIIQTGQAASLERTAMAAAGFGLTNAAFHGVGMAFGKGFSTLGERSRRADNAALTTTIVKDRQAIASAEMVSGKTSERGWHLVCGSGGSKAGLTSTGVILACRAAEIKLDTIGGVSGGAIPAVMAAAELPSHKMIELAKMTDFSGLLDKKKLLTPFIRERKKIDLLQDGIYGSSKLGELTDLHVKEWPAKFWTMAVGRESEVMFTKNGVVEYTRGNSQHLISSKPAQVGDAVRATCAIPALLESVTYLGRRLFDGALGRFGKCPTQMVTTHFGVHADNVIASLPVGAMSYVNKGLYLFAKYLSGNFEKDRSGLAETAGIVIRPEVNSFHSLKFLLNSNQKDEAILSGYRAGIEQFAKADLIGGQKLEAARAAGLSIEALEHYFRPVAPNLYNRNPELLRLTVRPDINLPLPVPALTAQNGF